jgi:hypothetical protein
MMAIIPSSSSHFPIPVQGDLRNLPEALAPLIAMPNWVGWRYEWKAKKDGSGDYTKPPVQANNPSQYARNNDPATWSNHDDAVKAHEAGQCDGIGFNVLNSKFTVLDIDDCREKVTGRIANEAMAIVHRAATYCEISPSGEGLRVISLGDGAYLHRKLKLPNSKISLEVYRACQRYFTVTGNPLKEGSFPGGLGNIDKLANELVSELSKEAAEVIPLLQRVREKRDLPTDLRNLISNPPPDCDLSAEFFHAVNWLSDCGYSADQIESEIVGRPIVPERYMNRLRHQIEECLRKGKPTQRPQPPAAAGVSLDDFHAFMPMHQYIFAPTGEMWPAASVNARIPPIKLGEGDPMAPSQWLDKNQAVEQMTWAPGEPQIISGRLMADGGWINREGIKCFNLYRPPTFKSGDAAKAGPWINHVCKVYGDDADHMIQWFAHRVQRPNEKNQSRYCSGWRAGHRQRHHA